MWWKWQSLSSQHNSILDSVVVVAGQHVLHSTRAEVYSPNIIWSQELVSLCSSKSVGLLVLHFPHPYICTDSTVHLPHLLVTHPYICTDSTPPSLVCHSSDYRKHFLFFFFPLRGGAVRYFTMSLLRTRTLGERSDWNPGTAAWAVQCASSCTLSLSFCSRRLVGTVGIFCIFRKGCWSEKLSRSGTVTA